MTPQELEMRKAFGMDSPGVDYAAPAKPRVTPYEEMNALVKANSADTLTQKQMEWTNKMEQEKAARLKQFSDDMDTIQSTVKQSDVAAGISLGIKDMFRNTFNGVVTAADAVENFAAGVGLGTGDLINESSKWDGSIAGIQDYSDKEAANQLGTRGKVARGVTQFAAPFITAMGTGGGALAATGTSSLFNFLAIDPSQARLSDALKETGLSEVPVVSDVIDALATKPGDTELMARFKNVAEGLGIDGMVAGTLWGVSRAYSGIKGLRNPKLIPETEAALKTAAEQVPTPAPVTPAEEAALKASEEAMAATAVQVEKEQLDLFEKQWAQLDLEGPTFKADGMRLTDDRTVDRLYEISRANMDAQVLRTPITDEELAKAAALTKNDPELLTRIGNWKQGDAPLTDEETIAFKYIFKLADDRYQQAISEISANANDEVALAKFMRETENYYRLAEIREGVASAKGATLRAEQLLGQLTGTTAKEATKAIGAEGRIKLIKGIIDNAGGKEQIKNIARSTKMIHDLALASKTPNADFMRMNAEIAKRSKYQQLGDAMTTVALNGMLSSPGTSLKAVITNAATNVKTIFDNYLAVGFGTLARNADRVTLQEANAHAAGSFQGLLEGIQPAWNVLKTGEGTSIRQDLKDALKPLSTEDLLDKSSGAWANTLGTTTRVLSADGVPVRALMSVDTYWHQVGYNGAVNAAAVRTANKLGLTGEEFGNFVETFKANPPSNIMEAATELAATNTMAKELDGIGARLADTVQYVNDKYLPVTKVLLPFIKTNFNLVEYTVQNTPFGFITPQVQQAFARGGREKDVALAKMMSGGAALAGFTYLAMNGLTNGKNSENLDVNLALRDNKTVAPETSIRLGDKWVSVKGLEPISTFLELGQTLSKASGYLSAEEYGQMAITAMSLASDILSPEALTDSLSGVLNVIAGKEEAVPYLASIPERFVPLGGAMRDVRQAVDPVQRATSVGKIDDLNQFIDTVKMRLTNIVPFYSKTLPAQRNLWGERLELPDGIGPDIISPFATTSNDGMALKRTLEAMDEYASLPGNFGVAKLDVKLPSRSLKNPFAGEGTQNYEMTPREYSRYQLYAAGVNPNDGQPLTAAGTLKDQVQSFLASRGVLGKTTKQLVENGFTAQDYTSTIVGVQKLVLNWRRAATSYMYAEDDTRDNLWNQAQDINKWNELGGNSVGQ